MFQAVLISFAVGFLAGAVLAYAFRGWIERTKAKEAAALQQSAQKAVSAVGGVAQAAIKKL
jgi:hypothetical protein